jgi:hypothetical protein
MIVTSLAVLGSLVLALAFLSTCVVLVAARNRELRSSEVMWRSAAEAFGATGTAAENLRFTGRLELADGSSRAVYGETIGQVVAAYGATNPRVSAVRRQREESQDPWTTPLGSV